MERCRIFFKISVLNVCRIFFFFFFFQILPKEQTRADKSIDKIFYEVSIQKYVALTGSRLSAAPPETRAAKD